MNFLEICGILWLISVGAGGLWVGLCLLADRKKPQPVVIPRRSGYRVTLHNRALTEIIDVQEGEGFEATAPGDELPTVEAENDEWGRLSITLRSQGHLADVSALLREARDV